MADTPQFYLPQLTDKAGDITLPEDTARHIAQVLRMQAGEEILLTNGNGTLAAATLASVEKKRVGARIVNIDRVSAPKQQLHLAVAFTKNTSRNEWLLEKATELGVNRITPLITARGYRERIKPERWNAILVSAMLQSKQSWLPKLDPPMALVDAIAIKGEQMLIAHCMEDQETPRTPIMAAMTGGINTLILIGPEGDFTPAEVTLATAAGAIPVSIGGNRLRTETAALTAIINFYLINNAL
jgi:16S rRNA (uracil1498-N3)-methyltransferase